MYCQVRGLPLITYAPRGTGGGRSCLLCISIAYYLEKGGEGVQIACRNPYVIDGRPLMKIRYDNLILTISFGRGDVISIVSG